MMLRKFQGLGDKYCQRYLWGIWDKNNLESNWWAALTFFLNHALMRGRRDDLSEEYYRFTVRAIAEYFDIPEKPGEKEFASIAAMKGLYDRTIIEQFKKDKKIGKTGNSVKHPDFSIEVASKNDLVRCFLEKRIIRFDDTPGKSPKAVYLGFDRDMMMILDVLKFVTEDRRRRNIYNYIRDRMTSSGVRPTYDELTGIYAVGDKLSAFIMRDIGLLNPDLRIDEYEFAFPVDTWVLKIAQKLGCETNDLNMVKNWFIEKCGPEHLDPLKVAAGLWYLGFNSLDIVLDNLELLRTDN